MYSAPDVIMLEVSNEVQSTPQLNESVYLTFSWSSFAPDTSCTLEYHINVSGCGLCLTITNNTSATCEVNTNELTTSDKLCLFKVQPFIHDMPATESSSPYTITLKGSYC